MALQLIKKTSQTEARQARALLLTTWPDNRFFTAETMQLISIRRNKAFPLSDGWR
jgi:hypothetical protein